MRRALFTLILLAGLVPDLAGAIEDAAHLFAEGHTLHQEHHDLTREGEHEEHSEGEEGCEDCGHEGFCHCHGGASLAAAPQGLALGRARELPVLVEHRICAGLPSRVPAGLDRPPRA